MEDPANPEKRRNQYSTFNSVLRVTKSVRFELEGYQDARTVILSGSFNDWNDKALKMRRTETGWALEVPLTGGKHLYKFIVDGKLDHRPRQSAYGNHLGRLHQFSLAAAVNNQRRTSPCNSNPSPSPSPPKRSRSLTSTCFLMISAGRLSLYGIDACVKARPVKFFHGPMLTWYMERL